MGLKIIEKALKFYLKHSKNIEHRAVSFYGGEPLLEFDKIVYTFNLLKSLDDPKRYHLRVDTNGVLLDEEKIEFFVKNNFHLQISLDGPKSIHDRHRVDIKGKGSFDRIVKNLNLIRKMNKSFYKEKVSFVVTVALSADLIELNDFFENHPLVKENLIMVNFVDPFDTKFFDIYNERKYFPFQAKQIEQLRDNYINARINNKEPSKLEKALFEKELIKLHLRNTQRMGKEVMIGGFCIPGTRRLFVDVSGYLYPCERVGQAYRIGNVDTGIRVDKINRMIENFIKSSEDCKNCWGIRLCGMCFAQTRKGKRFNIKRKKEYCKIRLRIIDSMLKTYTTIIESNSMAFDFAKNMVFM